MSENQESRVELDARCKEVRQKRLAAQHPHTERQIKESQKNCTNDAVSSRADPPRNTRASRLRVASASATQDIAVKESSTSSQISSRTPVSKSERDKSRKRKSNLNRSLISEEVPPTRCIDDVKSRRRRRRFFPPEVLQQSSHASSNEGKVKSDTSHTAYSMSPLSTSITASTIRNSPRISELSVYMENARKSVTSARCITPNSPKNKSPKHFISNVENMYHLDAKIDGNMNSLTNKESIKRHVDESGFSKSLSSCNKVHPVHNNDRLNIYNKNVNISERMNELTALTRETLTKVESLASKSRVVNKNSGDENSSTCKSNLTIELSDLKDACSLVLASESTKAYTPSILKKKSVDDHINEQAIFSGGPAIPVSILKRKVSQSECKGSSLSTIHTPPVTFSPNVVETTTNKKKQGILKKRRSLDESQVLRHRSCSPDVTNSTSDFRPILKNQRRSSLEEITRTRSPDSHLPGILKRNTYKTEDDSENPLSSPQSILKRKSGVSSAGSASGTQHVSIATAVILAAAGGAEIVLDSDDHVKPILKKKNSEECSYGDNSFHEGLKPILKKKSSTDTDDAEDKPKKPILKMVKSSMDNQEHSEHDSAHSFSAYRRNSGTIDLNQECEVKPILKHVGDIPHDISHNLVVRPQTNADSNTSTDYNEESGEKFRRRRPLSVSELVMNFEKPSTGAVPKKNHKRSSDRCRTQPVTFNELEASLRLAQCPQQDECAYSSLSVTMRKVENRNNSQSLLDLLTTLGNESALSKSLLATIHKTNVGIDMNKMSSDSAFQPLGDGIELDCTENSSTCVIPLLEKLDGKTERLCKVRDNESSPTNLSLSDKIKMFSKKTTKSSSLKRIVPKRRRAQFQTQPVTSEAAHSTKDLLTVLNSESDNEHHISTLAERKGILKSQLNYSNSFNAPPSSTSRSALKKIESSKVSDSFLNPKTILKSEIVKYTYDDGISSDDSSETDVVPPSAADKETLIKINTCGKSDLSSRLNNLNISKSPQVFNNSGNHSHTSDESSGSREIQRIIGREDASSDCAQDKSFIGRRKSKSHAEMGNEHRIEPSKVRRSMTQAAMSHSIGQLQAKLQKSGDDDWRKRIAKLNNSGEELSLLKTKNVCNEELVEKSSILAAKIDELDAASQQWKSRIEKSNASNFSVTGRMQEENKQEISINLPAAETNKTARAKRFRGKEDDLVCTVVSSDSANMGYKSILVPGSDKTKDDLPGLNNSLRTSSRRIKVLKPDDDTFRNFFKTTVELKTQEKLNFSVDDFDVVTRQTEKLLIQKRTTQAQQRREASKNPIRALARRSDVVDEYDETFVGIDERETRLNVERLAKTSSFALEALAGLASKEDFSSILLKKCSVPSTSLLPYKDLMLIQIKGRRHVQTRLIEPKATNINEGDSYILKTANALYNFVGLYSNIIEQSRASDIVNYMQQTNDMGCKVDKVITLKSKKSASLQDIEQFWKLLGSSSDIEVTQAGHPDEDEIYETSILRTNMIYSVGNNELIPVEKYWGKIPKIGMLHPAKVFVFDFGAEMYVWSGKNAPPDEKKLALKLAKELWSEGYNYVECNINPINTAEILGSRQKITPKLESSTRPKWGLFAKITQHRETILFREKFLDWPDYSRVIRIKVEDSDRPDVSCEINACDVEEMRHFDYSEPDFDIEGTHLGRGNHYFDQETNRHYEISNLSVTCWRILESTYEEISENSLGHLYDADTYIIKWQYCITITGRSLNGKLSTHNQTGRNRCLYFYWFGSNSSINEKGATVLHTIELDKENTKQIRVTQGFEPTVFTRLFNGKMVIHQGKFDQNIIKTLRLYIVRGEIEEETELIEVPCSMRSLRSRCSFILINTELNMLVVWNGYKSLEQTRLVAKKIADYISETKSYHFGLTDTNDITVDITDEGQEEDEFLEALGEKRQLYMSLGNSSQNYEYTPRLFHFSSISGSFKANEILYSHRNCFKTPYPFLQSELYSASQPALFLLDNCHELWLWQGWWPKRGNESLMIEKVGSRAVRWHAERKAAMQTTLDYWKHINTESKFTPTYLVWAGLEPLAFTNLFPMWEDRDDVAELNIKEGRKAGETVFLENELTQLTRTTYPLSQLLQRPLPVGVDPTRLEIYLSPDEFSEFLCMTKTEFKELPAWKQTAIKKEKGLF